MKQINFVSSLTGTLLCSFAYDWQERGRATDLQGLQILMGVALGGLLAPAHKGCRWNVGWKKDLCRQTESEEAERQHASLTDPEQCPSAAGVPLQMQEKRVPALSVCRRWQPRLNRGAQGRGVGLAQGRGHLVNV